LVGDSVTAASIIVSVVRPRVDFAQQSFKTPFKRLLTFQSFPRTGIVQCGRKFFGKPGEARDLRPHRTLAPAIPLVILPLALTKRKNITTDFALRRKIFYRF
jgi:hypothetical protein